MARLWRFLNTMSYSRKYEDHWSCRCWLFQGKSDFPEALRVAPYVGWSLRTGMKSDPQGVEVPKMMDRSFQIIHGDDNSASLKIPEPQASWELIESVQELLGGDRWPEIIRKMVSSRNGKGKSFNVRTAYQHPRNLGQDTRVWSTFTCPCDRRYAKIWRRKRRWFCLDLSSDRDRVPWDVIATRSWISSLARH